MKNVSRDFSQTYILAPKVLSDISTENYDFFFTRWEM